MTPAQRDALVTAAHAARGRAFAPYSGFHVGAAVLTADGTLYTGCNVEISSYSHTCCAERVAVFKAVSDGHRRLAACAVSVAGSRPVSPCGACRQVLSDFADDLAVLLCPAEGEVVEVPLSVLLPREFGPADLLGRDPR